MKEKRKNIPSENQPECTLYGSLQKYAKSRYPFFPKKLLHLSNKIDAMRGMKSYEIPRNAFSRQ